MSNYMKTVNQTKVTPDLLGEALELDAAMPPDGRHSFAVSTIELFELLKRKRVGADPIDLCIAITFRLEALARLHNDEVLSAWVLTGRDQGMVYVKADLVEAAAGEPLIENVEGKAAFDVEKFRIRVLANARVRGSA